MSERELNYSPNYDEYNAFIQRFSNSLVILITSRVGENDEGLSDVSIIIDNNGVAAIA